MLLNGEVGGAKELVALYKGFMAVTLAFITLMLVATVIGVGQTGDMTKDVSVAGRIPIYIAQLPISNPVELPVPEVSTSKAASISAVRTEYVRDLADGDHHRVLGRYAGRLGLWGLSEVGGRFGSPSFTSFGRESKSTKVALMEDTNHHAEVETEVKEEKDKKKSWSQFVLHTPPTWLSRGRQQGRAAKVKEI